MLSNRRAGHDERGITLIVVALSLTVLMVSAAFAIDLGAVYSERRSDQNAADAAITSGAVQFLSQQSAQAAVTEIVAKVDDDLGRTLATSDWTGCTDPQPLARTASSLGLTPATPCISFSVGFDRVRVQLPDQVIDTTFARVIGITSFSASAFAEATMGPRGGGALPFVVLTGNAAGDQVCLRTDGTGGGEPPDQPAIPPYQATRVLDPCNELSFTTHDGARGTIKPYRYSGCTKPTGNQSIVDAIMVGMDHLLGTFEPEIVYGANADANLSDSLTRARLDGANGCGTVLPNTVDMDTGLTAQLLRCGLLETPCADGSSATAGKSGRLAGSASTSTFSGLGANDIPLWTYLLASLPSGAPVACTAAKTLSASGATFYTKRAAMLACLDQWTPAVGEIFDMQIQSEKRLGFVPLVAENCLNRNQLPTCSQPLDNVHINSFVPVYIDALYQDKGGICDATNPAFASGGDWSIHYPGKGMKCGSAAKVDRVSGIVLPCGALPRDLCDPTRNPPFADPIGLGSVRLAK